jgi:hypothetical protein
MPTIRCLSCGLTFKSQAARRKHYHFNPSGAMQCRSLAELKKRGMTADQRGRLGTLRPLPSTFSSTTSATAARFARIVTRLAD